MTEPKRKAGNYVFSPEVQQALIDKVTEAEKLHGHTPDDEVPTPTTEELVAFVKGIPADAMHSFMYITMRFGDMGYEEAMRDMAYLLKPLATV